MVMVTVCLLPPPSNCQHATRAPSITGLWSGLRGRPLDTYHPCGAPRRFPSNRRYRCALIEYMTLSEGHLSRTEWVVVVISVKSNTRVWRRPSFEVPSHGLSILVLCAPRRLQLAETRCPVCPAHNEPLRREQVGTMRVYKLRSKSLEKYSYYTARRAGS